jgi:hypothetical protein
MRDQFPEIVMLRARAAGHANMLFGPGARESGIRPDELQKSQRGYGYAYSEERNKTILVRAAWVDDSEIRAMAADYAPAEVVDATSVEEPLPEPPLLKDASCAAPRSFLATAVTTTARTANGRGTSRGRPRRVRGRRRAAYGPASARRYFGVTRTARSGSRAVRASRRSPITSFRRPRAAGSSRRTFEAHVTTATALQAAIRAPVP